MPASVFSTERSFWNGTATQFSALDNHDQYGMAIGNNGGVGIATRMTHLTFYDEPIDRTCVL